MVSADVRDVWKDLKEDGRPVKIRVKTVSGGDPISGDPGTESVRDYSTYALEEEITIERLSSLSQSLGQDVTMSDKRFMVAACDNSGTAIPDITTAMFLVDGTRVYSISVPPRPFKPGAEVLYWTIQARGA